MSKKKMRKLVAKQQAKLAAKGAARKPGAAGPSKGPKRGLALQQLAPFVKGGKAKNKKKRKRGAGEATGHGYAKGQRVLLVGEGNFSFSRGLVRLLEGEGQAIVATSYDLEESVLEKYEEGEDPVSDILHEIKEAGVRVKYGINAADLRNALKANKKRGGLKEGELFFDRIVFNFPHVGLGIKDQDINVARNQALLAAFFAEAAGLLQKGGEIHVAVKEGKPYDLWNVVGTAHHATGGKICLRSSTPFDPATFPGYTHRRTSGYKDGLSASGNEEVVGRSRNYVFTTKIQFNPNQIKKSGSDSD